MEENVFRNIVENAEKAYVHVFWTAELSKKTCSGTALQSYTKLAYSILADMLADVLAPITNMHPEVEPEWLKQGTQEPLDAMLSAMMPPLPDSPNLSLHSDIIPSDAAKQLDWALGSAEVMIDDAVRLNESISTLQAKASVIQGLNSVKMRIGETRSFVNQFTKREPS